MSTTDESELETDVSPITDKESTPEIDEFRAVVVVSNGEIPVDVVVVQAGSKVPLESVLKIQISASLEPPYENVLPPVTIPPSLSTIKVSIFSVSDWRDADDVPGLFGAEGEYYSRLEPAYAVKNAPYETMEELLLVRGFTGQLLYGEDYDRNGLLTPNEKDGDETEIFQFGIGQAF